MATISDVSRGVITRQTTPTVKTSDVSEGVISRQSNDQSPSQEQTETTRIKEVNVLNDLQKKGYTIKGNLAYKEEIVYIRDRKGGGGKYVTVRTEEITIRDNQIIRKQFFEVKGKTSHVSKTEQYEDGKLTTTFLNELTPTGTRRGYTKIDHSKGTSEKVSIKDFRKKPQVIIKRESAGVIRNEDLRTPDIKKRTGGIVMDEKLRQRILRGSETERQREETLNKEKSVYITTETKIKRPDTERDKIIQAGRDALAPVKEQLSTPVKNPTLTNKIVGAVKTGASYINTKYKELPIGASTPIDYVLAYAKPKDERVTVGQFLEGGQKGFQDTTQILSEQSKIAKEKNKIKTAYTLKAAAIGTSFLGGVQKPFVDAPVTNLGLGYAGGVLIGGTAGVITSTGTIGTVAVTGIGLTGLGLTGTKIYSDVSQLKTGEEKAKYLGEFTGKALPIGAGFKTGFKYTTTPKISDIKYEFKQTRTTTETGVSQSKAPYSTQRTSNIELTYTSKLPFKATKDVKILIKPSGKIVKTTTGINRLTGTKTQEVFTQSKGKATLKIYKDGDRVLSRDTTPINLDKKISVDTIVKQKPVKEIVRIKTDEGRRIEQSIIEGRRIELRGKDIIGRGQEQIVTKQIDTVSKAKFKSEILDFKSVTKATQDDIVTSYRGERRLLLKGTEDVKLNIGQQRKILPSIITEQKTQVGKTVYDFDKGTKEIPIEIFRKETLYPELRTKTISTQTQKGTFKIVKDVKSKSVLPQTFTENTVPRQSFIQREFGAFKQFLTSKRGQVSTTLQKPKTVTRPSVTTTKLQTGQNTFKIGIPESSVLYEGIPASSIIPVIASSSLTLISSSSKDVSPFTTPTTKIIPETIIKTETKTFTIPETQTFTDTSVTTIPKTTTRTGTTTTTITETITTPSTPVNPRTFIPLPTPPPVTIKPPLVFPEFDEKKKKKKKVTTDFTFKTRTAYSPTLFSIFGGIKASKVKTKGLTGLGIRPILRGK